MKTRHFISMVAVLICITFLPASAPAQETVTEEEITDVTSTEEGLPGPKYLNLRYDEDFSYLDGEPGSYEEDFFDPIKNIHLGDDFRLTIGGEFRFRMESETNKRFGTNARTQDNFQLWRMLTHFDLKYRDTARLFFQIGSALVGDRDLVSRYGEENRFAFEQFFVDVKPLGDGTNLTVRFGRQELEYGKERFVSPQDWTNNRQRFDALKIFWHDDTWDFDVWYAHPVVIRPEHRDQFFSGHNDFYGAYVVYKGICDHGIDAFFFAQDYTRDRVNPNFRVGDMSRYTLGSRFWGKTGDFDYEAFVAGQWGKWAGDTIQAWAWGLDAGYTFTACPLKPRLGAGFDWTSGDEHLDGKVGTFDQLYPEGYLFFGHLDLVGRQNITAFNLNLSAWPVVDKVKARLAYHVFCLNDDHDALYDAAGVPERRDPTGHSGTEVGHELDLTVAWQICRHQSMLFGYSHFWDSDFIQNTGASEDPDLFYVQYAFKF